MNISSKLANNKKKNQKNPKTTNHDDLCEVIKTA